MELFIVLSQVAFVEDMTAEEKAEKGATIPAGLVNLRKL